MKILLHMATHNVHNVTSARVQMHWKNRHEPADWLNVTCNYECFLISIMLIISHFYNLFLHIQLEWYTFVGTLSGLCSLWLYRRIQSCQDRFLAHYGDFIIYLLLLLQFLCSSFLNKHINRTNNSRFRFSAENNIHHSIVTGIVTKLPNLNQNSSASSTNVGFKRSFRV